jgi:hypothetical protein
VILLESMDIAVLVLTVLWDILPQGHIIARSHLPGKRLETGVHKLGTHASIEPGYACPVYPQNQTISGTLFETDNLKAIGWALLRLNAPSF